MKPIRTSARSSQIRYAVRDVLLVAREAQKAGKTLTYLNIGDPNIFDFKTPDHVTEAICKAVRDNKTSYAPSEGIPEALAAIRQDAEAHAIKGIRDIFIGNGSSECIELALTALVDPGENILTPSPGYPLYSALVSKLGCVENEYFLDEENGWQPDLQDIEKKINDKTRAIVLINPNNPTGSVCSKATLEGVVEIARRHQLIIFADEIYDRLLLDSAPHISIASLADDVPILTFNGLSKVFLGPGLRLGWCIMSGPEQAILPYRDAIHKFLRARLSASHPVQFAVKPALEGDSAYLQATIQKLRHRRDIAMEMLHQIPGIKCVPPAATFYAFPRLTEEKDDEEFVKELIRQEGVVTVHGKGFGQKPGTSHFRIVFLPPDDQLKTAFTALKSFAARRPRS